MKTLIYHIILCILLIGGCQLAYSQVAVSTDGLPPHPSSMLDIRSTTSGMLIPRMTSLQRAGISSPAAGLMVFDTDLEKIYVRNTGSWRSLVDNFSTAWDIEADTVYLWNKYVSLGHSSPEFRLDILEQVGSRPAAVRVRGVGGPTNAYLGVQGRNDYDGDPTLDISGMEIGVLGTSNGTGSSDNIAIYGYSTGLAGYFKNKSSGKAVSLGSNTHAAEFHGLVSIDSSLYVTHRMGIGILSPLAVLHVEGEQNTSPPIRAEVMYTAAVNVNAVEGIAMNSIGKGTGLFGEGGNIGVEGYGNGQSAATSSYGGYFRSSGTAGQRYGIYGIANGTGSNNYGVSGSAGNGSYRNYGAFFEAYGSAGDLYGIYSRAIGSSTGTNYGIYAKAQYGVNNWAGYFDEGNVYIRDVLMVGVTSSNSRVFVNGASSSSYPVVDIEVNYSGYFDVRGLEVTSEPAPGYGIALHALGGYRGVEGYGASDGYSGSVYGGYFRGSGSGGTRYGIYASAIGAGSTNYGVYGNAENSTVNWAGYFNNGDVKVSNQLQVGGSGTPAESIDVKSGGVHITQSTTSPQMQTIYGNTMPIAYGYISGSSLVEDYGITSVSNPSTGYWVITLDHNFNSSPVIIATPWSSIAAVRNISYDVTFPNTIKIRMLDGAGSLVNGGFSFVVFGDPY